MLLSRTAARTLRARSTPAHLAPAPQLARTPFQAHTPSRQLSHTPTRMFALTPYRASQPRTFSAQKQLPRLPIQQLGASLDKYIKSLRPFFLEQAAKEGRDDKWVEEQLELRREWARDFEKEGGLGRVLQERLKGEHGVFYPEALSAKRMNLVRARRRRPNHAQQLARRPLLDQGRLPLVACPSPRQQQLVAHVSRRRGHSCGRARWRAAQGCVSTRLPVVRFAR